MHWWQSAVLYQIYPRSFQDGNGDGVGDLPGIKAQLPYLAELGVDAIWLSPIFVSPMADFGYDIADYTGIDPLFGSMVDFDTLLEAAHTLGMKMLLDFVPNHTSEPASLVRRRARLAQQSEARLVPLARWRAPVAVRRTTGYRNSAALPGASTRRPGSFIITPFCRRSRI